MVFNNNNNNNNSNNNNNNNSSSNNNNNNNNNSNNNNDAIAISIQFLEACNRLDEVIGVKESHEEAANYE